MSELNADNLDVDCTQDGRIIVEPSYLGYLRDNGYSIDGIKGVYAVESESSDSSHLVVEIETYHYPMSHPDLDIAKDGVSVYVCDCGDFTYRKSADVSDPGVSPAESKPCKHCKQVSKSLQAEYDPNQDTL